MDFFIHDRIDKAVPPWPREPPNRRSQGFLAIIFNRELCQELSDETGDALLAPLSVSRGSLDAGRVHCPVESFAFYPASADTSEKLWTSHGIVDS